MGRIQYVTNRQHFLEIYSTASSRDSNGWCSWPQSAPVHDVSWRISDVTHLELFVQQMNDGCPFLSQSVVLYDVTENKVINCADIRHYSNCSWPSTTRLSRCWTSFFQTFKKIIYSGFLPAFSGKFTYQSLCTIAFKIIQIFNQICSSSLSTISLVYIKA